MSELVTVYAGIGSNIHREQSIEFALKELQKQFGQLKLSSVFESHPHGFVGDNFFNLVCTFETNSDVMEVNLIFKSIERSLPGNENQGKFQSRKLDIDLLLFGDRISSQEDLQLPRDDVEEYAFVLRPLSELAPEHMHPVLNKTFAQLWCDYTGDKDSVWPSEYNPLDRSTEKHSCH